MIKKLIVVRHGQYGHSGHLNDVGREQILKLTEELKQYISDNMSVTVLASPSHRTRESAEIIASAFNTKIEESRDLLSEGILHPMNLERAYELIKMRSNVDILILVTHFDYVADLPRYYGEKELGVKLSSIEIGKGEAWVVDCQNKNLTLID